MDDPGHTYRERGLKAAVLAGDEAAWRLWYDESADRLYAYVAWRCGGLRDVADEVAQDVWLTAVRKLPTFNPGAGSFLAWLRGIAAQTLRNRFRRDRRRDTRPLPVGVEEPCANSPNRDQAQRVGEVLAGLPPAHEAVLRAKYLDGKAVVEIATEMGMTPKAVESLLTRARTQFRKAYESEE